MRIDELETHFGARWRTVVARRLGISHSAVSQWRHRRIVPPLRAKQLEDLSRGALKFNDADYLTHNRPTRPAA